MYGGEKMQKGRNGKIELLRFVFCICVLLYHINNDLWGGDKLIASGISFFSHGRTGVEFFFLVTGYLTAKSAAKLRSTQERINIGNATCTFMGRKVKSVFLPHIILCALMFIFLTAEGKMTLGKFLEKLPSLLFLQTTGLTDNYFIAVEWYICSMLFALVIIYPLLLKSFDFVSKVAAPVVSSVLTGYMIYTYGKLPSSLDPDPIISPSNLRGLAVVFLGVFCYAVSEQLRTAELSKAQKIMLAAVENICWLASLIFIISDASDEFEGIVVYLLAAAVAIVFSRDFSGVKLYSNSFVMYLGKISLTVYLCQNLIRKIAEYHFDCGKRLYVLLVVVLTVLTGAAIDFICTRINAAVKKRAKKSAAK